MTKSFFMFYYLLDMSLLFNNMCVRVIFILICFLFYFENNANLYKMKVTILLKMLLDVNLSDIVLNMSFSAFKVSVSVFGIF